MCVRTVLCAAFQNSTLLTGAEATQLIDWMVAPNTNAEFVAEQSANPAKSECVAAVPSADSEWECVWRMSRDGTVMRSLLTAMKDRGASFIVCTTANGSLFGGFTPLERPSGGRLIGTCLTDPSGRSFLFSLRNPHSHPPRPFRIRSSSLNAVVFNSDALVWGSGGVISGRDLCK
jgi:hypothetical protein